MLLKNSKLKKKINIKTLIYSLLTGSKPPGPASKTGAIPLGKSGGSQNVGKGGAGSSSGKGSLQTQGKGSGAGSKANAQGSHQVNELHSYI